MSMQMEEFYAGAKDADYIIYNSTIEGELSSVDDLLAKSPLFEKFKAVQEGHVYCTIKESVSVNNVAWNDHIGYPPDADRR